MSMPVYPMAFYNGNWEKQGLPFGYAAFVGETLGTANLVAGTNTFNGTVVPTGQLYVVTNIIMYYAGTVTTVALFAQMVVGGTVRNLFRISGPASNLGYDRQGWWVVPPGGNIQFGVGNATVNDDAFLYYHGFMTYLHIN